MSLLATVFFPCVVLVLRSLQIMVIFDHENPGKSMVFCPGGENSRGGGEGA